MKSLILIVSLLASAEQVIVFVDGTRMEIQSYEVRGALVMLTMPDGKLRSVPASYVDLAATQAGNRVAPTSPPSSAPRAPAPAMPTESIAPEPVVPEPEAPPPAPRPRATPPPPPRDIASPPPVWSNDELKVSLVVPSSDWLLPQMPPSFDVAVALEKSSANARATLALIRQRLRSRKDFERVVADVRNSVSRSPGYRSIRDGAAELDPYAAHEFRFIKTVEGVDVFNRLTVVYSRDLAYVLSLTCPNEQSDQLAPDFEAFVRGLVIKKARGELNF